MVMIEAQNQAGVPHYDVTTDEVDFACSLYWETGECDLDASLSRNGDGSHTVHIGGLKNDSQFDNLYQAARKRVDLQFTGQIGNKTVTVMARA